MNDYASPNDHLTDIEEPKKLPAFINVLTILTFIWSGVCIILGLWNFATLESNYEKMQKMQGSDEFERMPDFAKKMYSPEMLEMVRKSIANKVPILIITLLAAGLCIYGAIQMRKLQKQGYFVYLIGELLPIIAPLIFIGTAAFLSPFALYGLVFPVAFIIMYATQLKYMH